MPRPRRLPALLVLAGLLFTLPTSVVTAVVRERRAEPVVAGAPYGVRLSRGEVPDDAAAKAYRERRFAGARLTLAARSKALRERDLDAFRATLDRADGEFVERQERLFRGVAKVDLATWSYEVDPVNEWLPYTVDWARYDGADVYLPSLTLAYALRGFDPKPVARAVQLTFVERDGRWLVGGDRDVRGGPENADDPWDVAEVAVGRGRHSLVLGHPRDADTLDELAAAVDEAIPHVTAGWGADWARRVVVVAPRDTRLFESLFRGSSLGFDDVAAVAVPQFGYARGRLGAAPPRADLLPPVGGRIVVNPDNVDVGEDDLFVPVLLRHEITHLAQFAFGRGDVPKWLVEGFAEWVAYSAAGVGPADAAPGAADEVEAGRLPLALPFDTDFGFTGEAALSYDWSWLACKFVADTYGAPRLRALYRAVARETKPLTALDAIRQQLGLDEAAFLARWHAYLRTALA